MKFKFKGVVSVMLCVLLAVSAFSGVAIPKTITQADAVTTADVETAANEYDLLDKIEGSTVLHCWCWSFNTIKNNLKKIAEAGYTAVQTSPVTRCNGSGNRMEGNWWNHYQPTAYTIGNYQLGTEAEFKSLCTAAHSMGIKVIVDIVANHTSTDRNAVENGLKNISGGLYHNRSGGIDYSNRQQVTQNDLIGLPDINTQNTNVQNYLLSFLKKCVAAGADGFRYDAAKHIELPDDPGYGSNFWPTVLNNGSSFQYGEILEDNYKTARSDAYAKLMHVTASSYGWILREQIDARQITATKMSSYAISNVEPDRLVTWVESHDNYCDDNSWKYSNTQIRLAWAIAVAQGDTTSLFFTRPKGSTTSNMWGNNTLGIEGDTNYCHAEVSAVNKFHNAMAGQPKELSNLNDKSVLMISRGTSGAVIVNSGTNDVNISASTSLKDGTYVDYAHGGTFTVSGGTLKGKVAKEQIAVLYTDNVTRDPSVSIDYNGANAGGDFYGTADITLKASYATQAYYQLNNGAKIPYNHGTVITIGSDMNEGQSLTLTLSANGAEGTTPALKTYIFTKSSRPALEGTTCIYYDNSATNWESVCLYAYDGNGKENQGWPGLPMKDLGDNIWGYALDESWSNAKVIFNNNNNGQQDPSGEGYSINKGESKILTGGSWQTYTIQPKPTIPPTTASNTTAPPATTAPPTTAPPTVPAPTTVPEPSHYYGDANNDGRISINDVSAIQKHVVDISKLSPMGEILAKVNNGVNISIKDATCIQKYLVGFSKGIGKTGAGYFG